MSDHGSPSMEYTHYKLLHIVSVIIFLGNIITGLFWMRIAVKTRDVKIVAHTISGIIKSDRFFTVPGVVFITAFGIITAVSGNLPLLRTGWIFWSIVLFTVSGIIFGVRVSPLQKQLLYLTSSNASSDNFDWLRFDRLYSRWELWGALALLTPVAALVMMTLKIPR